MPQPVATVCQPVRTCRARQTADGRVVVGDDGACCIPPVTGLGVLFAERLFGAEPIWPGQFVELPAGNYQSAPAAWSVLVPNGWNLLAFPAPGFTGQPVLLPSGAHNLAAPVQSAIIRGPYTWVDARHLAALATRAAGWITAELPAASALSHRELLQLVMRDPARPAPPADPSEPVADYESTWRPGWRDRLPSAQPSTGSSRPSPAKPAAQIVAEPATPQTPPRVSPAPATEPTADATRVAMCEPPASWPYEVAPPPAGVDSLASVRELVASSPQVQQAIRNAKASATATGLMQTAAKFVPVIGEVVKVAAGLFEPLRKLFTKEPCIQPDKQCPDSTAHPDGRSFGKNAGRGDECCHPVPSAMGVLLTHHILGRGAPGIDPGYIPLARQDLSGRRGIDASLFVAGPVGPTGRRLQSMFAGKVKAGGALEGVRSGDRLVIPWDDERNQPGTVREGFRPSSVIDLRNANNRPFSFRVMRAGEVADRVRSGEWGTYRLQFPTPHRWPGWWEELAAGDFPDMGDSAEAGGDYSGRPVWSNLRWMAVIPEGWTLTVYERPGFDGDSRTFDAGAWDLWNEWAASHGGRPFASCRVRGWWTLRDSETVHHLRNRTAGWITAESSAPLPREQAITLALQDPCRMPPPASPDVEIPPARLSFWSPGWRDRLQQLAPPAPPAPAPVVIRARSAPVVVNPYADKQVVYR